MSLSKRGIYSECEMRELIEMMPETLVSLAHQIGSCSSDVAKRRVVSRVGSVGSREKIPDMGLNLPIRRVLFSATSKFDGRQMRDLLPGEVRQIAGRAGRYGLAEKGHVGVLSFHGYRPSSVLIRQAIRQSPRNVRMPAWFASPSPSMLDGIEQTLRQRGCVPELPDGPITDLVACPRKDPTLFEVLTVAMKTINGERGHQSPFTYKITEDQTRTIRVIDDAMSRFPHNLPMSVLSSYVRCPIPIGHSHYTSLAASIMSEWLRQHASGRDVKIDPRFLVVPDMLAEQEQASRILTGYIWLSMKYPDIYARSDDAREALDMINRTIIHAMSKIRQQNKEKKARKKEERDRKFKTRSRSARKTPSGHHLKI